jgi:hypothetical protein
VHIDWEREYFSVRKWLVRGFVGVWIDCWIDIHSAVCILLVTCDFEHCAMEAAFFARIVCRASRGRCSQYDHV